MNCGKGECFLSDWLWGAQPTVQYVLCFTGDMAAAAWGYKLTFIDCRNDDVQYKIIQVVQ
jgi:hypothetical protein